jgi:hypothetical protein
VPHRFRLASYANPSEFRTPKFRSESCPAREGASPKGARPCPQRARGEGCVTLAFPYDTNCIRIRVQGSCALWAGAMRYVDELRIDGVLGSSLRKRALEGAGPPWSALMPWLGACPRHRILSPVRRPSFGPCLP